MFVKSSMPLCAGCQRRVAQRSLDIHMEVMHNIELAYAECGPQAKNDGLSVATECWKERKGALYVAGARSCRGCSPWHELFLCTQSAPAARLAVVIVSGILF